MSIVHACADAALHESEDVLTRGRWVRLRGVLIWMPHEPPAPMTPGRERLLRIAHTRYAWHGHRGESTRRLEREYQSWRKREQRRARAA